MNLLKKRVEEVKQVTGSGTSMVSLYVPHDANIASRRSMMQQEVSEADNIKSKENRKNVKSAIKKVNSILSQYQETPENGLVVFAGVTNSGETVSYVFDDLPEQLKHSKYICADEFHTDHLEELIRPDTSIGLLVIERGGATIGTLRGSNITVLEEQESQVPSTHKAGGQSAARFERDIERKKEEFFDSITDQLKKYFIGDDDRPTVDGVIIGGATITVDNFVSDGYLPYQLEENLLGSYNIDVSSGETSLENLVNKAQDIIELTEYKEEKDVLESFTNGLVTDSETPVTYGEDSVRKAIQYGAVDTLLVSEQVDTPKIESLTTDTEEQGGSTQIISTDYPEGERFFKNFGGIGAILRYSIE